MPLRNIVVIALTAVFSMACYGVASKNRFANLFSEALDVVDRKSLREVPREELFDSAMSGMLKDLDPHSQYISGKNFKAFDEDIRQQFGGVGMYVDVDPESKILKVTAAMPDTPAFRAGLLPGDSIIKIEGQSTAEMTRADAIEIMRGRPGTQVQLTIESRKKEQRVVSLNREVIPVDSVHGDIRAQDGTWNYLLKENNRIGYIRLLQFGDRSVEEFRDALSEIDGKVDGLIVDLRNNSGGLLTGAVDICDMFLGDRKLIVQTRGRGEVVTSEHFSTPSVAYNANKPVVVLINRESASASEIVAACLRDHERAIIVGESSWGKGTVQNVIPIQRGQSALKLTTASFWPPSGKNFDRDPHLNKTPGKHGVHPHEGFALEMEPTEVYMNYRKRHERDLEGLIKPLLDSQDDAVDEEPHVDRPLQKAIEYFESVFGRRIAA